MIYGASPMPTVALRDAIAKFGPRLIQIYGQSEAPVTMTVLPLEDHHPGLSLPGAALFGGSAMDDRVEMKIVDDAGNEVPADTPGEVVLRAPQLMQGYWKRPDLTAETIKNGWLHTKDMGRMDAHGYVYLLGRKDEMITSLAVTTSRRLRSRRRYLSAQQCAGGRRGRRSQF